MILHNPAGVLWIVKGCPPDLRALILPRRRRAPAPILVPQHQMVQSAQSGGGKKYGSIEKRKAPIPRSKEGCGKGGCKGECGKKSGCGSGKGGGCGKKSGCGGGY